MEKKDAIIEECKKKLVKNDVRWELVDLGPSTKWIYDGLNDVVLINQNIVCEN